MSDLDIDLIRVPAAERAAYSRMIEIGSTPKAIRARVLLIAQERGLPQVEVDRALRASTKRGIHLVDFAIAHDINLNWLLSGDIRGLIAMRSSQSSALVTSS